MASGTIAAISEPVQPSVTAATLAWIDFDLRRARWRSAPPEGSRRVRQHWARSMKKSSSKRPLRSSSGGSAVASLPVAITKASPWRSCIQVRIAPSASLETPPSAAPCVAPASDFSISSNQTTASADALDDRRRPCEGWLSLSPTYLDLSAPRSTLSSGHAPCGGDCLGGQRLAGAGRANQEDALGTRQTVGSCGRAVGQLALRQPCLERLQTADGVDAAGDRIVPFQHALAGDHRASFRWRP